MYELIRIRIRLPRHCKVEISLFELFNTLLTPRITTITLLRSYDCIQIWSSNVQLGVLEYWRWKLHRLIEKMKVLAQVRKSLLILLVLHNSPSILGNSKMKTSKGTYLFLELQGSSWSYLSVQKIGIPSLTLAMLLCQIYQLLLRLEPSSIKYEFPLKRQWHQHQPESSPHDKTGAVGWRCS